MSSPSQEYRTGIGFPSAKAVLVNSKGVAGSIASDGTSVEAIVGNDCSVGFTGASSADGVSIVSDAGEAQAPRNRIPKQRMDTNRFLMLFSIKNLLFGLSGAATRVTDDESSHKFIIQNFTC